MNLASEFLGLALSAAVSFIILSIGKKKGFFQTLSNEKSLTPPTLLLTIGAFAIYFIVAVLFDQIQKHLQFHSMSQQITLITWVNFLTNGFIFFALFLLCRSIYRPIWETIWRKKNGSWKRDFGVALAACFLAFPVVLFVTQLLEVIVYLLFSVYELPDQNAVLFLKMAFNQPSSFFLATISIVLFAPSIEEVIFRGFLQNYLRRYLSTNWAILFTSALFTLFHFSIDQGLANIPILGSLFILAGFLGYVYERQGSLIASIFLHAIFNAINTINLYFFGV